MVKDLPIAIQKEIRQLLERGDFVAAKSMHDAWTNRYFKAS